MIRNRDIDSGRFKFGIKRSLLLIANYFVGYQFVYIVLASLIYRPTTAGELHPKAQMISTLITLGISVLLVIKPLKRSLIYFQDNLIANLKMVIKSVGMIYLLNIVVNLIIMFIYGDITSGNQTQVESGFRVFPILYLFTAVIFAPIVEEILFRGVFYQELRSKTNYVLATFISSLSFGLIHTLPIFLVSKEPAEILYLLLYSGMGFIMTRAYEKTGSIWGSVSVHFVNNLIASIVLLSSLGG